MSEPRNTIRVRIFRDIVRRGELLPWSSNIRNVILRFSDQIHDIYEGDIYDDQGNEKFLKWAERRGFIENRGLFVLTMKGYLL